MKKKNTNKDILAAILAAAMLGNEQTAEKTEEEAADTRKQSKILGDTMYQSMLGFMDAGFTIEQAFELVKVVGGR